MTLKSMQSASQIAICISKELVGHTDIRTKALFLNLRINKFKTVNNGVKEAKKFR